MAENQDARWAVMEDGVDYSKALLHVATQFPGGHSAAAAFLGMDRTQFRNRLYEIKGQRLMLDDQVALSVASDSNAWIDALCEAHGGVFVRVVDGPVGDLSVLESISVVWKEIGDVGGCVQSALADSRVNKHEVDALKQQTREAIQALLGLQSKLEALQE